MNSKRLEKIIYLFPQASSSDLFAELSALLRQDIACHSSDNRLELRHPAGGLPSTEIVLADTHIPVLRFWAGSSNQPYFQFHFEFSDHAAEPDYPPLVSRELAGLLVGHIHRIDHTGVEFPARQVKPSEWRDIVQRLARGAATYRYPSGEEWPFVLPTTENEFYSEIEDFSIVRTPKFEMTYGYVDTFLFQFHCDTRLTRPELETLLPAPYGFALPGVETFRSVFLASPWNGIQIRVDLTFWTGGTLSDWDSGEWLVRNGGRIHPQATLFATGQTSQCRVRDGEQD